MDTLPPDAWTEAFKVWPIGAMVAMFIYTIRRPLMAMFSAMEDKTEPGVPDVISGLNTLRAEMRDEFRELKSEQRETRIDISNIQQRVSLLEGMARRHGE